MKNSILCDSGRSRGQKLFARLFTSLAVGGMLVLGACGGSSVGAGGSSNTTTMNSTMGAAMVTLTDMPGDFLSYVVTVDSLQLTRADGTVVETVTTSTPVDFAKLVNLSEIISAQQLPAGSYVSATLTLDYSAASIVVDNGTAGGISVPVANIYNGTGTALLSSPISMKLTLPAGKPLVITPHTVANLALDFNLLATNTVVPVPVTTPRAAVTSSTTAVQLWVNPSLSASLMPDTTKQIRVRGPLVSVDTANNTYTIDVRPFFNATGMHGQFLVSTSSTTTFTINGTPYNTQSAGIAALNALSMGTLTAAYGSFDVASGTFTASSVLAGTSVAGSSLDSVEGTVTAVTANTDGTSTLTVTHGSISRADEDRDDFSRSVAVTVGPKTAVTEQGQSGSFSSADISVGQHLQLFGTYSNTSDNPTLDASNGSAILMLTQLWGLVQANTPATFATTPFMANGTQYNGLTLMLQALDGQPPSAFKFAGTGTSSANDANPAAYTVGVPTALSITNLNSGPARFYGFVTPFGTAKIPAPPPDFSAVTLVNYANTEAKLLVDWDRPGPTLPFGPLPLSATAGLSLSQSTLQSAEHDEIRIGPQSINPSMLTTGLTLQANAAAAMTQFAIAHRSSWKFESFSSFADLVTALNTDLNGTTMLLDVFADGPFNSTTGTLSVNQLLIALSD
jgi:Domain of unknown function (DUF4382)